MARDRGLQALLPATGALLAWFLLLPSLGTVQKYFGGWAALAYALGGTAGLAALMSRWSVVLGWASTISRRRAALGFAALWAGFAIAFVVLYPIANAGHGGGGSDRDDALILGARALLEGRYPYSERTYLGNPISQFPGSLFLAAPFAVLGNPTWQNLLWFGLWVLTVCWVLGRLRTALISVVLTLVASPAVLQDFITGGDLATNSIIVLAAIVLLARTLTRTPEGVQAKIRPFSMAAASGTVGLAMATRALFPLLLPLIFGLVRARAGLRVALSCCSIIVLVALAVTLPFYLHDPTSFTPLTTQNKFALLTSVFPGAGVGLPLFCAIVSVVAAAVVGSRSDWPLWLITAGFVLSVPGALLLAGWVLAGSGSFRMASYALPGLFFGVPGVWLAASRRVEASEESGHRR